MIKCALLALYAWGIEISWPGDVKKLIPERKLKSLPQPMQVTKQFREEFERVVFDHLLTEDISPQSSWARSRYDGMPPAFLIPVSEMKFFMVAKAPKGDKEEIVMEFSGVDEGDLFDVESLQAGLAYRVSRYMQEVHQKYGRNDDLMDNVRRFGIFFEVHLVKQVACLTYEMRVNRKQQTDRAGFEFVKLIPTLPDPKDDFKVRRLVASGGRLGAPIRWFPLRAYEFDTLLDDNDSYAYQNVLTFRKHADYIAKRKDAKNTMTSEINYTCKYSDLNRYKGSFDHCVTLGIDDPESGDIFKMTCTDSIPEGATVVFKVATRNFKKNKKTKVIEAMDLELKHYYMSAECGEDGWESFEVLKEKEGEEGMEKCMDKKTFAVGRIMQSSVPRLPPKDDDD